MDTPSVGYAVGMHAPRETRWKSRRGVGDCECWTMENVARHHHVPTSLRKSGAQQRVAHMSLL